MINNKLIVFQNYLKLILANYQIVKHQSLQDAYRIVEKFERNGKVFLKIQVVLKNIIFELTPEEIVADDKLLEHFSRKDVRTISYYACEEIKKPKTKIVFQEFCEKLNRMIFGIRKNSENTTTTKTANEISADPEILKDMSQEDAHTIGYITATELMLKEKEQIEKLKNKENT